MRINRMDLSSLLMKVFAFLMSGKPDLTVSQVTRLGRKRGESERSQRETRRDGEGDKVLDKKVKRRGQRAMKVDEPSFLALARGGR